MRCGRSVARRRTKIPRQRKCRVCRRLHRHLLAHAVLSTCLSPHPVPVTERIARQDTNSGGVQPTPGEAGPTWPVGGCRIAVRRTGPAGARKRRRLRPGVRTQSAVAGAGRLRGSFDVASSCFVTEVSTDQLAVFVFVDFVLW